MNKHIKEIALECYNPYSNFDYEKFAELVVQDCIDALHRHGWTDAGNDMKKHFGVEDE